VIKLDIKIRGTFCNSWPRLVIEFNNKKIFREEIQNDQKLSIILDGVQDNDNLLILGMDNKSFGTNGVWDTRIINNVVAEDKKIIIDSLKLNDIECKDLFKQKFYVKRTGKQPSYFPDVVNSYSTMNYNGYFKFNFSLPLYNDLINQKYKKPIDQNKSYFSNYTKTFHYEGEKKIINEISNLLKEIDEKFSDKRSQIRNS
jgi:hypothetical protein